MFFSEIYQPGVADFDPSGKFGYEAILRIFENTASRHSDSSEIGRASCRERV